MAGFLPGKPKMGPAASRDGSGRADDVVVLAWLLFVVGVALIGWWIYDRRR
jgi:hypothetical protein